LVQLVIVSINNNNNNNNDKESLIGLEINVEKTNYMLLSCHQNAGQNLGIKIANRLLKMWHSSSVSEQQ
jgi:hypothetical protein